MENLVNIDEFEKLLLVHWTKFINPHKLIAFVLTHVRDADLVKVSNSSHIQKKSVQITLSQFRAARNGFVIWADYVIPKKDGLAVGTCEMQMNPVTGEIVHSQTIGNLFSHTASVASLTAPVSTKGTD